MCLGIVFAVGKEGLHSGALAPAAELPAIQHAEGSWLGEGVASSYPVNAQMPPMYAAYVPQLNAYIHVDAQDVSTQAVGCHTRWLGTHSSLPWWALLW